MAVADFQPANDERRDGDARSVVVVSLVYVACSLCGAAVTLADATKDEARRLLICPACGP